MSIPWRSAALLVGLAVVVALPLAGCQEKGEPVNLDKLEPNQVALNIDGMT